MARFRNIVSSTITSGTSTSDIDLGAVCSRVLVMNPAITSGTITVHVSDSDQTSGTYYPMYALKADNTGDFANTTGNETTSKGVVFDIGASRYIKVVFSTSQSTLTVKVRGII